MKSKTIFIALLLVSIFLTACNKEEQPNPKLDVQFELALDQRIQLENKMTVHFDGYSFRGISKRMITLTINVDELTSYQVELFEGNELNESEEIEGVVFKLLKLNAPIDILEINETTPMSIELQVTEK